MRIASMFCAIAALTVLTGCGNEDIAAAESSERGSALARQAAVAEQSGNPGEAILLLERSLLEEPKAFSAHFQLATLLQDHARDYMGAIYHYRQYLKHRPASEKSKLAKDRIRVAEQLLAPQILKRVGDSGEAAVQASLLKDVEKLNKRIAELVGDNAALAEQKAATDKSLKMLEGENRRLRKIVDSLKLDAAAATSAGGSVTAREAARAATGGEMLRRPGERGTIDKSEFGDLRKLREEANALAAEGSAVKSTPAKKADAAAEEERRNALKTDDAGDGGEFSLSALLRNTERKEKKLARKHVVRPGETLYMLSERFYGTKTQWKRIRDANRATINPDGRLIAGQTLWIP